MLLAQKANSEIQVKNEVRIREFVLDVQDLRESLLAVSLANRWRKLELFGLNWQSAKCKAHLFIRIRIQEFS